MNATPFAWPPAAAKGYCPLAPPLPPVLQARDLAALRLVVAGVAPTSADWTKFAAFPALSYNREGKITYQDLLGDYCLGITALGGKDADRLLVGCTGKCGSIHLKRWQVHVKPRPQRRLAFDIAVWAD
jgi:hypothetical protein